MAKLDWWVVLDHLTWTSLRQRLLLLLKIDLNFKRVHRTRKCRTLKDMKCIEGKRLQKTLLNMVAY